MKVWLTTSRRALLVLALLVTTSLAVSVSAEARSAKKTTTLHVATSIYAPVDFYSANGKTLQGFDYEIMQAVAKKLNATIAWSVIDFSAILPGITAGRYDFATDLNDTAAREKAVDFVTEYRDGTSILVKEGNPERIKTLLNLCGKTVVMTKGSVQIPLATAQSKKCTKAGKSAIKQLLVSDDPPAKLALKSGQADAYLANTLASSYAARTSKDFEVVPGVYQPQYAGIIFPKKSAKLRTSVCTALNAVIQNGTYMRIMRKYGVVNNAISKSVVNAATGGRSCK